MSLVEVVRTPTGEEFCVEAYAVHSIGARLRRSEDAPGEWRVDVFRWPGQLHRRPGWSVVIPSKQDGQRRLGQLVALLEAGRWSPGAGDPEA